MSEGLPTSLCRAADLLQAAFFAWREARLDWKIYDFVLLGGKLRVYVDRSRESKLDGTWSIFDDFPKLQGPSPDGKAILSYCGCDDTIAYMFEICKNAFGTMDIAVESSSAQMNVTLKYVIEHNTAAGGGEDDTLYDHSFYRVRTPSGQRFVLDLSCAQHDIQQPVMLWHQYMDNYVEDVRDVTGFGCHERDAHEAFEHIWAMANDMNHAVDVWEVQHMSIRDLLRLEDVEYQTLRQSLVDAIRSGIRAGLRDRHAA